MNHDQIWNSEATIADLLDDDVPAWIEQDITANTVIAIWQGGCASGAYMPAVTYYDAIQTMSQHGDDVLQYVQDMLGELPQLPEDVSWGGIAVHFLSAAVDIWAGQTLEQLESLDDTEEDEDEG